MAWSWCWNGLRFDPLRPKLVRRRAIPRRTRDLPTAFWGRSSLFGNPHVAASVRSSRSFESTEPAFLLPPLRGALRGFDPCGHRGGTDGAPAAGEVRQAQEKPTGSDGDGRANRATAVAGGASCEEVLSTQNQREKQGGQSVNLYRSRCARRATDTWEPIFGTHDESASEEGGSSRERNRSIPLRFGWACYGVHALCGGCSNCFLQGSV